MTITYAEAVSVHEQADLLVNGETIAASIDTMAAEITATLSKECQSSCVSLMAV